MSCQRFEVTVFGLREMVCPLLVTPGCTWSSLLSGLQTTPRSSECLQSWTPHPFDLQSFRVFSVPSHLTLSIQMGPVTDVRGYKSTGTMKNISCVLKGKLSHHLLTLISNHNDLYTFQTDSVLKLVIGIVHPKIKVGWKCIHAQVISSKM